jgi:selenocysteine lyase/cysteine desulfurase
MEWYASVHRGSGYKSLVSTQSYEQARETVARFISADTETESVIFVKNTTEAVNILAHRFGFGPEDMVLTTLMEHHSNDLPWRAVAMTLHAGVHSDGSLDLDDLQAKLQQHAGHIKLVAVTGASNVTGFMPPIYQIAELAHRYGLPIFVDCAQLFPHRRVIKGQPGTPQYLDFIAFSGHKVYAPYGGGALVGPKTFFNQHDPDYRGGGTIKVVTTTAAYWADTPDRDEPGSPNIIGAIALDAALRQLESVGMDALAAHEAELTTYLLEKFQEMPEIKVFGCADPRRTTDRLGVVAFQVENIPHGKVAAILGFEGGIGVRSGCYCAHPYVLRLLNMSEEEFSAYRDRALAGDRVDLPGMVRASFGCYNDKTDIDHLVSTLKRIIQEDYQGQYEVEEHSGSYYPAGFDLHSLGGANGLTCGR